MALTAFRPMLEVNDMAATIHFWTVVLGFTVTDEVGSDSGGPPRWCNLSRDGVSVMFTWQPPHSHDDGSTHSSEASLSGALYFNADDVDALSEELRAKAHAGAIDGPSDQPHGMREIHLDDPNGFRIYFGQPI